MDLQSVLDKIEYIGSKRSMKISDIQALKASVTDLYRKTQPVVKPSIRGIIPHDYVNASDDLAQWEADGCGRQEVTPEWFSQYGVEHNLPFYLWTHGWSEEMCNLDMDPWIVGEDFDYQMNSSRRVFVQKQDLIKHGFI